MNQTMKRVRNARLAGMAMALAVTALAGCTTLPEPTDGSDTAFVLPVIRVVRSESSSTFGYYEIYIERVDDPSVRKTVKVYAGTDMRVVTGLEPGRYVLRRSQFVYKNGGRGSTRNIDVPFVLEAGAITISPTVPVITLFMKDPDSSTNWMRIRFKETELPIRREALDTLEQEESFAAWRVLSPEESRG